MQRRLVELGCAFELIGYESSLYDGPYTAPEGLGARRVAQGGFSTRGILNWISSKNDDLGGSPDIWVQYLGANNEWGGFIDGTYNPDVRDDPEAAYIADTKALIGIVREKNPEAHVVLVKIQNGLLPGMDQAIDQLVEEETTDASPVVAVGGASGVSTTDGLHPDADGAKTLAEPIAEYLAALLAGRGLCEI